MVVKYLNKNGLNQIYTKLFIIMDRLKKELIIYMITYMVSLKSMLNYGLKMVRNGK